MMKDFEIFDADLFQSTGLDSAPIEEKTEFIQELGRLLGMTGLILAGENLPDKDQDTLLRLLNQEEGDRAEAFLTTRGVDLEDVITREAIRIKRPILESGNKMHSVDELLMAVKAELPPIVLEIESATIGIAIAAIQEYIDALPFTEEQRLRLAEDVQNQAYQDIQDQVSAIISPEVFAQVDELMDSEQTGEAFQLMFRHGVDFIRINVEEAESQLSALKEQFKFLQP